MVIERVVHTSGQQEATLDFSRWCMANAASSLQTSLISPRPWPWLTFRLLLSVAAPPSVILQNEKHFHRDSIVCFYYCVGFVWRRHRVTWQFDNVFMLLRLVDRQWDKNRKWIFNDFSERNRNVVQIHFYRCRSERSKAALSDSLFEFCCWKKKLLEFPLNLSSL